MARPAPRGTERLGKSCIHVSMTNNVKISIAKRIIQVK